MNTHNLCFEQNYEKISEFLSEIFHFLVVKFSAYLNRHVFVTKCKFKPYLNHIVFMETDQEMVILPLPLIQEGWLSVTDESMCKCTG